MKPKLFFILLLIASYIRLYGADDFTEKEKSVIYTNAIKVLEDYSSILNQIGESVVKDIDQSKSGAESFLELFVNRQVLVFNDLDPAHKLSEFYEAETYCNSLILWYPDGITINLDLENARVSEILKHDATIYSLDILAKKTINGNYRNETVNRNVEELTFRIAFSTENKSPDKFRIVGIRNASSNLMIDYSQALKEVNNADFSQADLVKVQDGIKTVLGDYSRMLFLFGDPQEVAEDKVHYRQSFLELFRDSAVRIYNDITPEAQTNLLSVKQYLENFVKDYPEGIRNLSVNPDSARFGQVIKADDGSYYSYAEVTKFFSGNFGGKETFRNITPLTFKISFNSTGNTFSDFRIAGIDVTSADYFDAGTGGSATGKPEIAIRPVTRKGLTLLITGSFAQTSINDGDIKNLSMDQNSHSWNVSPLSGYITAIGVGYYLNDNISVRSGVELNTYKSKFTLNGTFTSSSTYLDINSSVYHKVVEASYDSLVKINYATIPVTAAYTSGKPGKFGFYGEGGIKISIPLKAEYSNTGHYKYSGYYPNATDVLKYIDFKELGFYRRDSINISKKLQHERIQPFSLYFDRDKYSPRLLLINYCRAGNDDRNIRYTKEQGYLYRYFRKILWS